MNRNNEYYIQWLIDQLIKDEYITPEQGKKAKSIIYPYNAQYLLHELKITYVLEESYKEKYKEWAKQEPTLNMFVADDTGYRVTDMKVWPQEYVYTVRGYAFSSQPKAIEYAEKLADITHPDWPQTTTITKNRTYLDGTGITIEHVALDKYELPSINELPAETRHK